MKYATFNVLADAYIPHGDYRHADSDLMRPGARRNDITQEINDLQADVIGIQEADSDLVKVFENDTSWQTFWAQKGLNKPDGALLLVKDGIEVSGYESHLYNDGTGHVFQVAQIGKVAIANTHIKWAPENDEHHAGVRQTRELIDFISDQEAAVILADSNGQPGGRVQTLVEQAGFTNINGERPTANINGKLLSLDLLAVRGLKGSLIPSDYDVASIPNKTCASDHTPIVAIITN